jgi:hypothetical protein
MRIVKTWGPPLAALLLVQCVLAVAARRADVDPFASGSYVRWDAYRYLQIAKGGYYLELTTARADANTGWFPGYPSLVRAVQKVTRAKPALAGRIVALAFQLAALGLLWSIFLRAASSRRRRWLGLLLAAFFPGFVYYGAVFPISMVVAASLVAILAAADGRFLWAGASGAIAAFAYPTGVLVAVPLLLAVFLQPDLSPRQRLLAAFEGPLLCALGLVAVLLYHQLAVGRWDAFFVQQLTFDHGLSNPLATLSGHLAPLLRSGGDAAALVPALQTVLVAVLVTAVAVCAWRRRALWTRGEALLMAHVFVFWLVPQAVGSGVSIYRAESLLLPIVPLVVRWPTALLVVLLALFVALGGAMAVLFFQTVLI